MKALCQLDDGTCRVDLSRYVGGSAAARAGAIGAGDMTDEAALTKLMVTLGRADGGSRLRAARDAFAKSPVGEMSARLSRSVVPPPPPR